MSITLREVAEKMKPIFPNLEWVTYDGKQIRCYEKDVTPEYSGNVWVGMAVATLKIPRLELSLRNMDCFTKDSKGRQKVDFEKCIFGFEDNIRRLAEDKAVRDKHTTRKKGVIAYFGDGSTVVFDTFTECKEFLGLSSIGDVRKAIDNGTPVYDGRTLLDETPDPEFLRELFRS